MSTAVLRNIIFPKQRGLVALLLITTGTAGWTSISLIAAVAIFTIHLRRYAMPSTGTIAMAHLPMSPQAPVSREVDMGWVRRSGILTMTGFLTCM